MAEPEPLERAFHALQWRLEVPVARRTGMHPAQPVVRMKWDLARVDEPAVDFFENNGVTPIETEWISTDYEGLLKLRAVVDDAVKSLQSAPYRRMQRIVK